MECLIQFTLLKCQYDSGWSFEVRTKLRPEKHFIPRCDKFKMKTRIRVTTSSVESPAKPELIFVREVLKCSSICLIKHKIDWNAWNVEWKTERKTERKKRNQMTCSRTGNYTPATPHQAGVCPFRECAHLRVWNCKRHKKKMHSEKLRQSLPPCN